MRPHFRTLSDKPRCRCCTTPNYTIAAATFHSHFWPAPHVSRPLLHLPSCNTCGRKKGIESQHVCFLHLPFPLCSMLHVRKLDNFFYLIFFLFFFASFFHVFPCYWSCQFFSFVRFCFFTPRFLSTKRLQFLVLLSYLSFTALYVCVCVCFFLLLALFIKFKFLFHCKEIYHALLLTFRKFFLEGLITLIRSRICCEKYFILVLKKGLLWKLLRWQTHA